LRNPAAILNSLAKRSLDPSYQYHRLYRNLFREDLFYLAYQRIYAKPGNMTPGSDGKTIDGTSLQRIKSLIDSLTNPVPHEGFTFQSQREDAAARYPILQRQTGAAGNTHAIGSDL
jgi:hypothetical protein